jgi:hypothetical protein
MVMRSTPKNKKLDRFGGIEKLVEVIRYIHHHPRCGTGEILAGCKISQAGFYRHRRYAARFLGVEIRFGIKPNPGHYVEQYGIIDRKKL